MSADADLNQPDVIMRLTGQGGAELLTARRLQISSNSSRASIATRLSQSKGRVLADIRAVMISDELILLRGRLPVMHQLAEHLKPSYVCPRASSNRRTGRLSPASRLRPLSWQRSNTTKTVGLRATASLRRLSRALGGPQVHLEGWREDLAWQELSAARARVETQTIGQYLPQDLNFDLNRQ